MTDSRLDDRSAILQQFGATPPEVAVLLAYNASAFVPALEGDRHCFPLPSEPQVDWWQDCMNTAKQSDLWTTLQQRLVPLQFPIQGGISQTEPYRQAVLRGQAGTHLGNGVSLQAPDQLHLVLYPSLAGKIPVLFTSCRPDFTTLVQALAHRNEPYAVPDSMGACLISGFMNWHRLAQRSTCGLTGDLRRGRALESDRLMLLSAIPYSNVTATEMGLDRDRWLRLSLILRLEHECTHYLTKRLFGSMQNRIWDELIADFWGMTCAWGTYRADWFLRFLGLEAFPLYRTGGRLQNYRGNPPLPDGAFKVLQRLVIAAAENLETFMHRQQLDCLWSGLDAANGDRASSVQSDTNPDHRQSENAVATLLLRLCQSAPAYPEPLIRLLLALTHFTLETLADPTQLETRLGRLL